MFPIKPSKQSLIGLGAVAVLLLLVCGFTYYNLASRVRSMDVQIGQKTKRLENSQEIARRLTTVEGQYFDAQTKLSVLEQGVSTKAYVPTLLRQVEELGKSVNLRVIGVRPKVSVVRPVVSQQSDGKKKVVEAKPEPYDKLEIDVEMNGKYTDVMRFLYGITSFPKIIAVNAMQIKPTTEPNSIASPELSVKVNTTAFILKNVVANPANDNKQTAQAAVGRT